MATFVSAQSGLPISPPLRKLGAYSSDYPVMSTNYHGRLRLPFLLPCRSSMRARPDHHGMLRTHARKTPETQIG